MNNIWNELSEESKMKVLEEYASLLNRHTSSFTEELKTKDRINHLETLFGEENLKSAKPKIKTWEDLEMRNKVRAGLYAPVFSELSACSLLSGELFRKLLATIQIAELIEQSYGGMITDEEWRDYTVPKYYIWYSNERNTLVKDNTYASKEFIAFHTEEQRDEFFENNKQLCRDYYMI